MKLLSTPEQINTEVSRLLKDCDSFQIAVAWASAGFGAFDTLVRNRHKIKRMVVGTHFCQTDPSFIEEFMSQPDVVRFQLNPDGVFHPKVYLFEQSDGAWECIVGSPNFTNGGLGRNDEIAMLVSHLDKGAEETLVAIQSAMGGYWGRSASLSPPALERYKEIYKRNRVALRDLRGKFGTPGAATDDGGKPVPEIELLQMSWLDFYARIQEESRPSSHHCMKGRLTMMRTIGELFQKYQRFDQMQRDERQRVAGLVRGTGDGIDYYWFGRMSRVKNSKNAVENECEDLSRALDAIPITGAVSREAYMEYVERFERAFPDGGCGIGTATRLLAMKRPDWFFCLDSANKGRLCVALKIPHAVNYDQYWDSIIARIIDPQTIWWNAPSPQDGEELEVWEARVAFLDAIYYDETAVDAS